MVKKTDTVENIFFHVSSLDKVTRMFTTSELVVTSIAEQCVCVCKLRV